MTAQHGFSRRSALGVVAGAAASGVAPPLAARSMALRKDTFEVLAEGLAFPEGPVVMPDGSVLFVELISGMIRRAWNGKTETVSEIGGGPNGAAIGPDGALYVCNNGGARADNSSLADPAAPGRIERLDLSTGKVDRLYETSKDLPLSAPNDIVFDAEGAMWFTDFGKTTEECFARGGVYYARPDGSEIKAITRAGTGFNGIGLSPDSKFLYVCKYHAGRLYRMAITGPGEIDTKRGLHDGMELVASGIGDCGFDGLAVTAAGNICVGTNYTGGLSTITPGGDVRFRNLPERMVTNVAFGGADMRDVYLTWSMGGKLVRMRWGEPGLPLNFSGLGAQS